MKDIPERRSLRSRLGWFAVLYLGGVLAAFMLAATLHVLVYDMSNKTYAYLVGRQQQ